MSSDTRNPYDWTDRELVDELAEVESGLTEWECRFADDVAKRVIDHGLGLTRQQRKKCVEILLEKAHD